MDEPAGNANWHAGNAADDSAGYRGWLVGHFVDQKDGAIRQTTDLEVKWGVHATGDQRPEWVTDERRSTLILLVSGRFRVDLPATSVTLARQGDYLAWGPGIDHSWQAEEHSVVITIRWPSLAGS
jgi:hypothetical protein